MKHCIVILDGAAGWPLDELGGRTTLAAADTPNLDALARSGRSGLARTVPEGSEPSSAAACMSILGYDPVADAVGRGAIEAASMGITLGPDDVALRMNLVTIEDGIMTSYSCGHISTEESTPIVEGLQKVLGDDSVRFYPGIAYRHILVVSGHPGLLGLSYTPPHDISDKAVAEHLPSGPGAGFLLDLMERAHVVLAAWPNNYHRVTEGKLPATDIWPFWPGVKPAGLKPLTLVRGVSAAMTSGVDLLNGLAALTGVRRLSISGVTDGADNDYAAQATGAIEALGEHDLVVIHVESPDEEGHAGDAAGKVAAIEAIDREVVARVRDRMLHGDLRVLCLPDHPTPIALKTHVGDPVPFVLAGPGVEPDEAERYDEAAAAAGGVLVDPGRFVMDALLSREAR